MIRAIKITQQIADHVREQVLKCHLKPGERLIEKNLCEDLGVSRASLREALTRLAHEHILDQIPNRGYSVPQLTLERFHMICEARRCIEADIAALAARRATEEDIAALRKAAPFVPEHKDDEELDAVACMEANKEFHSAMAKAARNDILERVALSTLNHDNQPYFFGIDLHSCIKAEQITREHLEIVDAIEKGDAELARALAWKHLETKEARIVAAWNAEGLSETK